MKQYTRSFYCPVFAGRCHTWDRTRRSSSLR